MQSGKAHPEQRVRTAHDYAYKFDVAALRAVMAKCQTVQGDYKDVIAAKSAQLFDMLVGTKLVKQAQKLGLLDGYNCPRATVAAWESLQ